jgi:hypothetical protein
VNVDGTASFEPVINDAEISSPTNNAHQFNWFNGSYEHTTADRTYYSLTAVTDKCELVPEEIYSTENLDGYKMGMAADSDKSKSVPLKAGYEAGTLCSSLKYETKILNAPSLFMLYADGTGARLLQDADVYPYVKNLAVNSNCEIVEEAVEHGVSVSVLENNMFRQVC